MRARRIRWRARCAGAISEGSSQSGTFLRAFIRLGFNQDETGRIVWEGSNPNIASRVIDMNRRFALPGGDVALLRARHRSAGLVGRLERRAARTRQVRPARSLPRHEHVPEDHGNVRQRRNLEPARVVHAGRHRREGGHSAAGHRAPLLLRRRHARRRPRRIQQRGDGGRGCELPANPAPSAPMRSALMKAFVGLGHDRRGDAAEPISDDCRWHARAEHERGDGISDDSRQAVPSACTSAARLRSRARISTTRTPPAVLDGASPKVKRSLPQLVVKVDADGNEVAGMKSPLRWRRSAPTPAGM